MVAFATVGCTTTSHRHVGVWAYEDSDVYLGIALDPDGTCKVVGASKRGPGAGFFCKYFVADRIITMTEVWAYGGTPSKPREPMQLKYDAENDQLILEAEKRMVLGRTSKLIEG